MRVPNTKKKLTIYAVFFNIFGLAVDQKKGLVEDGGQS